VNVLRRYWPDHDPDRLVQIASQRAMSSFCGLAGLSGIAITLINLQYLPEYALPVGIGAIIAVGCLLVPLVINGPGNFETRARIVALPILVLLATLSALNGTLVSPHNLLMLPGIMTFTLAVGWRSGLAMLMITSAAFVWNYTHTIPEVLAIAEFIDFRTILTAMIMSAIFVFCGATIFRREMIAAARRLQLAQFEAEAAMRHYRERAQTDALTGIANRGAFDEFLALQIARAGRLDTPLSVVILDLDHFKRTNDTHGHTAGDRVLIETAKTISDCLRDHDLPGRLGGEEFGVILPDTSLASAAVIAERIRLSIACLMVRDSQGTSIPVTTSIGVAKLSAVPTPTAAQDVMEAADQALYVAKRTGRNRVSVDGELTSRDPDSTSGTHRKVA
jgi:diguanylate cyclase (GGDEF)-like protein